MPKPAGYSGTPLPKKLGLKENFLVSLTGMPSDVTTGLKDALAQCRVAKDGQNNLDFAMIFVKTQADLGKLFVRCARRLAPSGMLWVSWPKKASGVATDLNENTVRDLGLAIGLVDIKVCAVSEIWSGLKFVIPVKDRKKIQGLRAGAHPREREPVCGKGAHRTVRKALKHSAFSI